MGDFEGAYLIAALLQPRQPRVLVPVPLVRPLPNPLLVSERVVVFFRDLVAASHDDETSVVGSVLVEVDEPLEAAETGSFGVLVLVGPSLVWGRVFSVGPLDVDDVKGDNEVVSAVDSASGS